MIRNLTMGLWLVLGCLAGCVDINGGAVELRWEIRQTDGNKTDCSDTGVASIRLCAQLVDSTSLADGGLDRCDLSEQWTCSDYQGSTGFSIPPGRYALTIEPVCNTTNTTPKARVPDAIVRDISNGNVAELNTLVIVKTTSSFICVDSTPERTLTRSDSLD